MSLEKKIQEIRYLLDLNEPPFDDIPDEFFTLIFPHDSVNQCTKDYLIDHNLPNYQKLEWLGDSVLELVMRTYLFQYRRNLRVGDLNDIKQKFVSNKGLYELLDKYSICEITSSDDVKECADILETIIGIIYYWLLQTGEDPIVAIMNWFLDTFELDEIIDEMVSESIRKVKNSPKKSPKRRRIGRQKRQQSP